MKCYQIYQRGLISALVCLLGALPLAAQKYQIHIDPSITGGKVEVEVKSARVGERILVKVKEEVHYALRPASLTVEKNPSGTPHPIQRDEQVYAFDMPAYDVLIRAVFVRRRIVRVWRDDSQKNGEFRITPNENIAPGSPVAVKVIPLNGYTVVDNSVEYSADGSKSWKPVLDGQFVMPEADVWVRARFAPPGGGEDPSVKRYKVILRVAGNGQLDVTHDGKEVATEAMVKEGAVLKIETRPHVGYRLVQLLINQENYSQSTYTVRDNTEIYATFAANMPTPVADAPAIRFYPNPVHEWLYVDAPEAVSLSIFTSQGVLMETHTMDGRARIHAGAWAKGVYVLRIQYADRSWESALLRKQ